MIWYVTLFVHQKCNFCNEKKCIKHVIWYANQYSKYSDNWQWNGKQVRSCFKCQFKILRIFVMNPDCYTRYTWCTTSLISKYIFCKSYNLDQIWIVMCAKCGTVLIANNNLARGVTDIQATLYIQFPAICYFKENQTLNSHFDCKGMFFMFRNYCTQAFVNDWDIIKQN